MARANFVKQYADADAAGRVDIICKNYPIFLGIVDSSTDGLIYVIENEKAYNRSQSRGDLGVRVQTSGAHSDVTANMAISKVIFDVLILAVVTISVLQGNRSLPYGIIMAVVMLVTPFNNWVVIRLGSVVM